MTDTLTVWLDTWYSASQMGKGSLADIEAKFQDRINASQAMKAEAHERLKALTPAICKRDHISRIHRDILERTLNA